MEVRFEVVPQADRSFAIRVVRADRPPVMVYGFRTEFEARQEIARYRADGTFARD